MSALVRLDHLLGREVYSANGRRVGRLNEFRAEPRGDRWVVVEYVIGAAGLVERLGLSVRLVLGLEAHSGYVVRWNQLDIANPKRLRLTCTLAELRPL